MISARARQELVGGRRAFALVVTLIMLVLAAVIAVGLLTTASLDRTTSKSVHDHAEAELAAQNGLEAAKKALIGSPTAATSITGDDSFLVLRADGTQAPTTAGLHDAYYYIARPSSATTVDCYPLFAGGATTSLAINATTSAVSKPTAPSAAFSQPAQDTTGKVEYPLLYSFHRPAYTQWQEIDDPNDTGSASSHKLPYQRYTYWVEDLSAYVDASVAGNDANGGAHQRSTGTNPNEVALFTVFSPDKPADDGTTSAKALIDNRGVLLSVPTLKQIVNTSPDVTQPNLAVRLGIDSGGEQNLIPFGFAFVDAGKPKTNLNTVVANGAQSDDEKVNALSNVMDTNLPQFAARRKGGLPATENYTKSLAAGMLSYATSQPVIGSGYRGIGLHPSVVEFYERFTWEPNGAGNFYLKNGTYWADVKAIGYAELWNMTNRDITSGTLSFNDINRYYAYVGGSSEGHPFDDKFGTAQITFDGANTLAANSFKVVKLYEHLYNFDSGLTIKPTGTTGNTVKLGSEPSVSADPINCGYEVKWNGTTIDRPGSGTEDGARSDGSDSYPGLGYKGLERGKVTLTTPNSAANPSWRGTLPGLRYALPSSFGESVYNLGDPRSAYLISQTQSAVAYDIQSAWGGRMYQKGLVTNSGWKAAETKVANWPDGGHSTVEGVTPGSTTVDPTNLTGPASEAAKGPTFFATGGKYNSITELSHIYDPIQWQPAGFPPASADDFQQKWRDAWKSNMAADPNYGCASTLHIGSPEFKNFDTSDARATRLLDLFAVSDRRDTRGLINVNTASRDVLRALGAGIEMKGDGAMTPASVYGPLNDPNKPIQADKFADAVIANRPFLSTAQFADICTDQTDATSKLFGNAAQWSSAGPTEWNDVAREEYFARMYNLTTTRSRNFRVFVTGQSLDKNGNVLSTVNRVFQVFLKPTRDATGKVTSQKVQITYEGIL